MQRFIRDLLCLLFICLGIIFEIRSLIFRKKKQSQSIIVINLREIVKLGLKWKMYCSNFLHVQELNAQCTTD